ncbi:uncharacterized protein PAF06_009870 [Gastrophryne carolinensis]
MAAARRKSVRWHFSFEWTQKQCLHTSYTKSRMGPNLMFLNDGATFARPGYAFVLKFNVLKILFQLLRERFVSATELRSSLVTFQNASMEESRELCEGIIVVFNNDTASLVCDDDWGADSPLARVACREAGCGTPNTSWALRSLPQGSLQAVHGVRCTGSESNVCECESLEEVVPMCRPENIATISCNQNFTDQKDQNSSLRLSRGRSSCDGHVELFAEGGWSPVCYTSINTIDASLFCEQLGCTPQRPLFSPLNKGKSPVPPVMLQCPPNRTSIWECELQVVDQCVSSLTTYLQCNRSRMEESWLVWLTICLAVIMIFTFCWVRIVKSSKCCSQCLHKNTLLCCCRRRPHNRRALHLRRSIYHQETPNLTVQETNSPPSSPAILQDPCEVNALLAPHGFRLNNTITPPPSYMHALKVLSRPLENTQTPPPSYLEALKILSRPVLVHVNASDYNEDKEDLSVLNQREKNEES